MRRGGVRSYLALGAGAIQRMAGEVAFDLADGGRVAPGAGPGGTGGPTAWLRRHPAVAATAIAALYALLLVAWMRALPRPFEAAPRLLLGLDASRVLFPALLLTALGWWRLCGLRVPPWHKLKYSLPPVVFPVGLAFSLLGTHLIGGSIAILIATDMAVAFGEESVFRGPVLRLLAPAGALRAAVVSSLLFGAIHTVNLLGGVQPVYVGLQVVWTSLIGFAFAATVLASGNVWPAIAIHFAIDLLNDLSVATPSAGASTRATVVGGAATVAVFAALAVYGWWLLRAIDRPARPSPDARLDRRDRTALPWAWLPDNPYAAMPEPAAVRLADVPVGASGSPIGRVPGDTTYRRPVARRWSPGRVARVTARPGPAASRREGCDGD